MYKYIITFIFLSQLIASSAWANETRTPWMSTPWPELLPCQRLEQVEFDIRNHIGAFGIDWTAASGPPVRFAVPRPTPDLQYKNSYTVKNSFPLSESFPGVRLISLQLRSQVEFPELKIKLQCSEPAGLGSITWECSVGKSCRPEVTYQIGYPSFSQRFHEHWWSSEQAKPAKGFLELMKPGASDLASMIKLARDLVHDANLALELSCAERRCSALIEQNKALVRKFALAADLKISETIRSELDNLAFRLNASAAASDIMVDCKSEWMHHVGYRFVCNINAGNLRYETTFPLGGNLVMFEVSSSSNSKSLNSRVSWDGEITVFAGRNPIPGTVTLKGTALAVRSVQQ